MSASSVFNLFKKSIDKTVETKTKVTEKIEKIAKSPSVMDFRQFYEDNSENIERVSNFSKSSLNSIQSVLAAEKKTPISYFNCAGEIRAHYNRNFNIPAVKPNWYAKYCDEWVQVSSYYIRFCKTIEKQNKNLIILEPLPEPKINSKTNKQQDIKNEDRERILIGEDFHVIFTIDKALHISKKNQAAAKNVISKAFWTDLGDQVEFQYFPDKSTYEIQPASKEEFVSSEKATQVSAHLNKFLSKEINRSVLFYGPPGTGKSNIVKNIAHQLGHKTMRMNFSDIKPCASVLNEWLAICKPDVIIIEDIDHAGDGGESALATLEKMNKACRMLLATANAVSKLNDAVVRPGRFDELIEIDKMDDQVLLKIVGGDVEVFDLVKDFPIASTMELMKRIDALGRDEALKTIGDIQKRLTNMKSESCKL